MKLSDIQPNPNNPRIIKGERFLKLKENIERYPKFLEKRPIVIDSFENPVILGGNMRFKALKELGYKELPAEWIKEAKDFTEEEKRAFVIIDNIEYGEEDWDVLANQWSTEDLEKWGIEIPGFATEQGGEDFSLKDGDKAPFQQMTFTLSDAQAERIKECLKDVEVNEKTTYGNENSNGNALHQIVLEWAEQRKLELA